MRVKFLRPHQDGEVLYRPGEVADIDDRVADALLVVGYCERADTETASVRFITERAIKPKVKPRGK